MSDNAQSRRSEMRPLDGAAWRAGVVAIGLFFLCGTSLFALLSASAQYDNPRRSQLGTLWSSVKEGQTLAEVAAHLGPADDTSPGYDRIPACADPCQVPCSTFHTCVNNHMWFSSLAEEAADVYTVCTDEAGVVRRASRGVSFRFGVSSEADHQLIAFLSWQIFATILALPVALVLWAWHRWTQPRPNGNATIA